MFVVGCAVFLSLLPESLELNATKALSLLIE